MKQLLPGHHRALFALGRGLVGPGVKPRSPWQLQARLSAGASGLVWLDVRPPEI